MILDKFNLKGKTALVTGANKGIGQGIALGLAEAGASVIGTSRGGDISDTEAKINAIGNGFRGYTVDFADRKSLYTFLAKLNDDGAMVDILVNNAGTIMRKPAAEHPDEYWDKVVEVNLNAQFILSRELGKKMVERGKGKIVFIASLLSYQGGITVPGYAAAKGGIKTLTAALSNEWASKGVNVNAIAPGYIATDNTAALRADENRNRAILERIPAARWGDPEDLAGAALFLASDASNYVNGTVFDVDGGWMGR